MTKRVVLAYSGGLDTSVAVKWIQEEWDAEVIALAVDVGQQADDPWDEITARAPRRRRRRGPRRRRPRRVRRRLPRPRHPRQRALRGQVPAGVRAVAAGDRAAPGAGGARVRRRRGGSRLHRQGQRPGALRGVGARAGPRPRRARAGARVGLHPRRQHRLRRQARHPDQRHQEEPVLHRREPVGPRHRVRHHRGPVGVAARRRVRCSRATSPTCRANRSRSWCGSRRAFPSRSTAW